MPELSNADFLRQRFVARILEQSPESVLDLGCGSGAVVKLLRQHGVATTGLEADSANLESLSGPRVVGHAEHPPFVTGSYAWVVIRHVLHHLVDPGAAICEAFRVARRGVIAAEPWLDHNLASQRTAATVDNWTRRHDRRLGRVHEADISPLAIAELAPSGRVAELEIETVLRVRERNPASLDRELQPRLAGLGPDRVENQAIDQLRETVSTDGWSWNGSAIVVMHAR